MARDLPVGKAQQVILGILGKQAHTWSQAERIFEDHGIIVRSVRIGRSNVPQVRERRDDGGWNPGHEDGDSGVGSLARLTAEQRESLKLYWID